MNSKHRIYLLGDSITQGLGSKKVNFSDELTSLLGEGYEVVNLAYTGTTIDYALKLVDEGTVELSGSQRTCCVVIYGNVDAQIRPNREGRIYSWIPSRYKGGGMLMPRPFYSRSLRKKAGQCIDNAARKVLSSLIKVIDGTEQWVPIDSFTSQYEKLVEKIIDGGSSVVCCSCVYIDQHLFPGTPEQYDLFNGRIAGIAKSRGLVYVDFYGTFRDRVYVDGWDSVYNKDHFHPNGDGYRLMAEKIAGAVVSSDGVL